MNQPFDFRDHMERFGHEVKEFQRQLGDLKVGEKLADLGALLNRGQPEALRPPTVMDDLRDLWADIAAEPGSHLAACFAGLAAGAFGTLGLAFVWSLFL